MIWDWNVNNNTPTGHQHQVADKAPPNAGSSLLLRERDGYRIGKERGIKGGDNKHLICSLHSFGSAVCWWVNKAQSVQCRHVIQWTPCHVAVIAAIYSCEKVELLEPVLSIEGRQKKSVHSLAKINQQNLDQLTTVLKLQKTFSSATKSLKNNYPPTFIKTPQQPLSASSVSYLSSACACKDSVNPVKPLAESTYDQLWQED